MVLFVDIGFSKTTLTVGQFGRKESKNVLTAIEHLSDRNLGGRDLDWKILARINQVFVEENDELEREPRNDVKCCISMLSAIEKARTILSADVEASITIDSLIEDLDLDYTLTRDEF